MLPGKAACSSGCESRLGNHTPRAQYQALMCGWLRTRSFIQLVLFYPKWVQSEWAIRVGVLLPWCFYPGVLPFYPSGKAPYPLWLLRDWLLSTFGETERAAVSAYRRFVEDGIGQSRAW